MPDPTEAIAAEMRRTVLSGFLIVVVLVLLCALALGADLADRDRRSGSAWGSSSVAASVSCGRRAPPIRTDPHRHLAVRSIGPPGLR